MASNVTTIEPGDTMYKKNVYLSDEPIKYKLELKWTNILLLFILHVFAFYGCYLQFCSIKSETIFFGFLIAILGGKPFVV